MLMFVKDELDGHISENTNEIARLLGELLVLRLIIPGLLSPERYGLQSKILNIQERN